LGAKEKTAHGYSTQTHRNRRPGSIQRPSWAQQQSDEIEVVKVTAQKRKEDPAKVAMSISAVTGAQLQRACARHYRPDARGAEYLLHRRQRQRRRGPGTSNVEIRGISSTAGAATVGIYLGDTPVTVGNVYTMGNIEPRFFDIDRVEVLRGPQATLYGASSMGGTIKFVPNEPDLKEREFTTYTEGSNTKGGSANYAANVVANFPLIPRSWRCASACRRSTAAALSTGGWRRQSHRQQHQQDQRPGIPRRAEMEADARSDDYAVGLLSAHRRQGYRRFNLDLPLYQAQKQVREPSIDKLLAPSVTINWDLGEFDLTSATSYFQRKFDRTQNGSAYNSYSLSTFLTSTEDGGKAPPELMAAVAGLPSAVYLNNQVRQVAQEFRLASHPYDEKVSPWTWLAGTFFAPAHQRDRERSYLRRDGYV
jgi:outer membrane receptor protein involved in Fe transport